MGRADRQQKAGSLQVPLREQRALRVSDRDLHRRDRRHALHLRARHAKMTGNSAIDSHLVVQLQHSENLTTIQSLSRCPQIDSEIIKLHCG